MVGRPRPPRRGPGRGAGLAAPSTGIAARELKPPRGRELLRVHRTSPVRRRATSIRGRRLTFVCKRAGSPSRGVISATAGGGERRGTASRPEEGRDDASDATPSTWSARTTPCLKSPLGSASSRSCRCVALPSSARRPSRPHVPRHFPPRLRVSNPRRRPPSLPGEHRAFALRCGWTHLSHRGLGPHRVPVHRGLRHVRPRPGPSLVHRLGRGDQAPDLRPGLQRPVPLRRHHSQHPRSPHGHRGFPDVLSHGERVAVQAG